MFTAETLREAEDPAIISHICIQLNDSEQLCSRVVSSQAKWQNVKKQTNASQIYIPGKLLMQLFVFFKCFSTTATAQTSPYSFSRLSACLLPSRF